MRGVGKQVNNIKKDNVKSIIALTCVAAIGGVIFALLHYYQLQHPTEEQIFVTKFNDIQHGETAEMVENKLGPPEKISESNWKEKKIVTEMPQQIWDYNFGDNTYSICFEPDGLKYWEEPMKWLVWGKGYMNQLPTNKDRSV